MMDDSRPVVVVEDDAGVQRALGRLLGVAGFGSWPFGCAEELLACGIPPGTACLLVDIQLPGLTGLQLVERLRALGPVPPVVFMTAADDLELREAAVKLGGTFLGKPFTSQALLAALRTASTATAL